ncbi:uroporphyrinogen-III C-methyltransferase [Alteromonas sp. 5E99-2]|uniref:uroporphyrinogen-III C-methyltransferase n=1 Tax=Alteromonas sp. 5E99-2 TaxID=2817683 RepID=UPI001A99A79D|nr:uroporphyrinogen-III C-methyltransferase [Alteromonas sp. 5E99-2]MBO1255917.1 uroporphyrinogen-III C-methyltransferase [Alteromonas sp. 5E99-2]
MTTSELLVKDTDNTEEKQTKTPKKKGGNKSLWIAISLLFLCFLACSGTAFWFFTEHYQPLVSKVDSQDNLALQLERVAENQQGLSQKIEKNQNIHGQTEEKLAQTLTHLKTQDTRIKAINTDINQLNGARASDWLVAEADYLTRMAGRKLWLEDDTHTAVLLLKEADLRLEENSDPSLLQVRQAIAEDIQRIEQVNPVSSTDIALTLTGIINTLDSLPLNTLVIPDTEAQALTQVSDDIADWRTNLARVWQSLVDDFVSVKRNSTNVEPLMSASQRFLITEQLALSLQQSQYAALHYDAPLYEASLQQSISIVEKHYDLTAAQTKQFINHLSELAQKDISRPLPSSLISHGLLQKALSSRLNASSTGITL